MTVAVKVDEKTLAVVPRGTGVVRLGAVNRVSADAGTAATKIIRLMKSSGKTFARARTADPLDQRDDGFKDP